MKELKAITVLLAIIVIFVIGVVLYQLSSVLIPFVVALLLSFIFKPMVLWLVAHRVPNGIALILVLMVVAGGIFLLSLMISPSVDSFVENLPKYQVRLTTLTNDLGETVKSIAASVGADASKFNPSSVIQISTVTAAATASLTGLITSLSNAFLVLLFLLFLLAGSGELAIKVRHAFSESNAETISNIVTNIDRQVRQYLVTKTIINAIMGVVTAVVLLIFGVDFAIVWGLLAFLLNYIPNFGSLVATIFPVLMAFLQFDSPTQPIIILILLVVLQNLIGNVLEPKMMQMSLNLSPVLLLVTLIFWGWLWGVWGMILAVPITSTIKIICENVESLRPIAVLMSGKMVVAKK